MDNFDTQNSGLDLMFDFNTSAETAEPDTSDVTNNVDDGYSQPGVTPQQPVEPEDNWQVRASYWQSKHDTFQNQIAPYMPLIQRLASDPEAVNRVQQVLTGQQPVEMNPQSGIQVPMKPVKPHNYSLSEAMNDPESPSAKYELELRDYLDKFADYQEYTERIASEAAERAYMEQKAREQQSAVLQNTYQFLVANKGMRPEEATDFIRTMASPQAINMDNLLDLYRLRKGMIQQNVQPQKPRMPLPPIGGGSTAMQMNQQNADVDRQFEDNLFNFVKKRK